MDTPNFKVFYSLFRWWAIATIVLIIALILALTNSCAQSKLDSLACQSGDAVIRVLGKKTIQVDCDTSYFLSKSVFRKYSKFADYVKNGQLNQLLNSYDEMLSKQKNYYDGLLSESKTLYQTSSFALTILKTDLQSIQAKLQETMTDLGTIRQDLEKAEKMVQRTRRGMVFKIGIPTATAFVFGFLLAK